ncbi:MAG: glycosyltransferase [Clostridium sp.]|uniref:glycosyltransferase n=1 Tax=Clostridium sp. TaxID=1506 RepID=UPI002FCA6DF8
MRKVLIASYDMEIGGVERSLINMLSEFDYSNNKVDLMLYSHSGDFFNMLSDKANLLSENEKYKTFRQSIAQIFKEKLVRIGTGRVLAKVESNRLKLIGKYNDIGYVQMQYMWKYTIKYLPALDSNYDVAISYLWPHHFVAEKVKAKKKIAWIHTDYSVIETDINEDLKIWNKYDNICAVSEECKNSFLKKYPGLMKKVQVVENITSPKFIENMSKEEVDDDLRNERGFKLVSVGRFSYAKGIDDGVRALKILHERGMTNIKWYVVGYGGEENIIRELISEYGLENSFILIGKRTNPYPYMKACDLYVQPSRYEGKAVTVGEAQILGKPVLITNYSTAKSQVKQGIDGFITEKGPDGIADGVEKLYKDHNLRFELSRFCKKTNFGNTEQLENLYNLF